MVRNGRPLLVTIKKIKWVEKQSSYVAELIYNDALHSYWTNNRDIVEGFQKHENQRVCLIASGNQKQKTDTMQFQPAGIPASSLPPVNPIGPRPTPQNTPQSPQKPVEKVIEVPVRQDKDAKHFLCQAANLMRLCVKKANDIAVELNLPEQHRQGIATTLFIQADRQGYIKGMPITAYTPEQLGFGSSKAESLKNPEPNND